MNRMIQFSAFFVLISFNISGFAQVETKSDSLFTKIYDIPTTSVKDQFRSGTCWSFSGLSFLESEMLRMGNDSINLSEMFVVRNCYADKAQKYVRLHGSLSFGSGGVFEDILYTMKNYGLVPEKVYSGLNYGETGHVHGEMDAVLKSYVDAVILNNNKKLSTAWLKGFNGVLDAYLGVYPSSFRYKSKSYTPQTFLNEVTGLNPDDYIQVTSFSHHPYYQMFALEIPDNWQWGQFYNLPLDELIETIDFSLSNGYTVAWAADVSENGFSHQNGIANVPDDMVVKSTDTERNKWDKKSFDDKTKQTVDNDSEVKEKVITPEIRQLAFDNYETTDDHGLHIIGLYKNKNGTTYYKVKNSWNTDSKYNGYLYVSESFVRYKTTSIMINKNSMPNEIRIKLGIN